ncbi:hypothetical protein E4L59_003592 [Escherichia coli]|nr:hypothetical protein [Escherichia coli]
MLLTSLIFTLIWHMHLRSLCCNSGDVHLQRHQDAVILIDKILTYNPENNQGTRWLLGAELLRAGKHGRALYVLTGHVNEFPPYWYELALLHFMNEAYINAATAFRYGFLTSIYC